MRPTVLIALAVLGAAAPSAHAATYEKTPALSAKVTTCTTGADDGARAAAFTGSMPSSTAPASRRMQMRFVLLQRTGSGPKGTFKRLSVPGWGGWEKSDPGRDGFVFTKRVEALVAPAAYKVTITFRWYDAKGRVLRTTSRTSAACEQPDPRPDLVLAGVDAVGLGKSGAVYSVSVENDGHSDADPFAVTVTVDGAVSAPVTLGPLAAGARAEGAVQAPKCAPGSTITIAIDVADTVDESVEGDDVVQRPCPLA
jgi:hypothetical protein